ncbi:MAG: hypothetical protein ACTSR8_10580 [Promethearchaeota archaeon]
MIIATTTSDLVPIIPGNNLMDIIVLLIIIPIIGIVLIICSPILALGYYKLYLKIYGDFKLYFLDMRVQLGNWTPTDIARRSATPGLMICAFAQLFVNATSIKSWVPASFSDSLIFALYNAAFFTFPIVILLLTPLWLLYDSGVMSKTAPETIRKFRSPEIVETMDKFFLSKFKGFAGIAFITNFIVMIFQIILQTISIVMMVFIMLLPLLGISLLIPAQTLYEKLLPRLTRKVHMMTNLHKSELTILAKED